MRIIHHILLLGLGLTIPLHTLAVQAAPRQSASVLDVLRQPTIIHWQGITLREACRRLADTERLPIFIDRRVDPLQPINIQVDGVRLQEALLSVSQQADAELAILPSLCYLGPAGTAIELPTLLEVGRHQVKGMSVATRRKLSSKQVLRWQRLATPQQVLDSLMQPLGIPVIGLEQVPHDLWSAGELPESTVSDQLTILLAGFDLTWQADEGGDALRVVPIERPVRIARSYSWRGATAAQLQQVAAELPAAKVRRSGEIVELNGTADDHEKLRAIISDLPRSQQNSRRPIRPMAQTKLYSLRLQNQPVGDVLRQLARQLKLDLRVDDGALRAVNLSLDTRISIDVVQVELESLLETIGEAADISVKATATELEVAPR
ncbi:MAG: hypothetical protein WD851_11675 [Pirellulales bacterium]